MRSVRRLAVSLFIPLVAVLAACQPMPHTEFTVVEAPLSPARLMLLSGDGHYAVVRATGATATVPGAGTWRVDRRDHSVVQLPGPAKRISSDGNRILLTDGDLWVGGSVQPHPTPAVFSDDLTAMAFRDVDGTIKTTDLLSLVVRPVETGFPRPAGSVATPVDVSDDGDTVQYRFDATVRVVDLAGATKLDLTDASGTASYPDYDVVTEDRFVLAAGGGSLAHLHQVTATGTTGYQVVESWIDLLDVATGTARNRYTNSDDQSTITTVLVGAGGDAVWSYQRTTVLDGEHPACPSSPMVMTCVVASQVTLLSPGALQTYPIGGGDLASMDIARNGRFLLLTKQHSPFTGYDAGSGPVLVIDWLSSGGKSEVLSAAPTYTETDSTYCYGLTGSSTSPCTAPALSSDGHITDNGSLVATSSVRNGWYEYRTAS